MGMDAILLAAGPFKKDLVTFLEYPPRHYQKVPEGAHIITKVIVCDTTSQSTYLAEVLEIDPWKFEQHVILSGKVERNINMLRNYEGRDFQEEYLNCRALAETGFTFYYLPEG